MCRLSLPDVVRTRFPAQREGVDNGPQHLAVAQMCYHHDWLAEEELMSTTTIRMPAELKPRIHQVAKAQGMTAHALIPEAMAEKADCAERRMALVDAAKARMPAIAESGETIGWQHMRDHLKARSQGQNSQPPQRERLNGGKEQVYCSM